jgi:hypothetical protein
MGLTLMLMKVAVELMYLSAFSCRDEQGDLQIVPQVVQVGMAVVFLMQAFFLVCQALMLVYSEKKKKVKNGT